MDGPPPPAGVPAVSVIVTAQDRDESLAACLESLREQTVGEIEIIVVLLDPTRPVVDLVAQLRAIDDRVKCVRCPPSTFPSTARNIGIAAATAEIIFFLDDDTRAPPRLLATLLDLFAQHPEADIIGGPNLTPPEDPPLAQLVGEVLGSRWGTGVSNARYRARRARAATERDLILCNIGIRKRLFEQGASFPERMFCGEENALFGRVRGQDRRLWYSPDLWIFHRRRSTLRGVMQQMYRYGRGRAHALRLARHTFHIAFFAPAGLLLLVLAVPLSGAFFPIPLTVTALYLAGSLAAAARICYRRREPSWLLPLTLLFPVIHLSYGAGLLVTLVKHLFTPLTAAFRVTDTVTAPPVQPGAREAAARGLTATRPAGIGRPPQQP